MKINDLNGPKTYGAGQSKRAEDEAKAKARAAAEQGAGSSGDTVKLSERSKEIARARELADGAPEIRQEKVAEIKARYEAGTYDVNAEMVADAIIRGAINDVI